LDWDRFIPESPFFVLPASMTEEEMKEPLMTRFFSGHFVFVEGTWIEEVPYDPNLFFHGEEGSLAVRSWTSGYDLFNPNIQSISENLKTLYSNLRPQTSFNKVENWINYYISALKEIYAKQSCVDSSMSSSFDIFFQTKDQYFYKHIQNNQILSDDVAIEKILISE
jgi:hypothetical protein